MSQERKRPQWVLWLFTPAIYDDKERLSPRQSKVGALTIIKGVLLIARKQFILNNLVKNGMSKTDLRVYQYASTVIIS